MEEPDLGQAAAFVAASGLVMVDNSLLVVYDDRQHRYDVPPFVLNEPEKYGIGQPQPKGQLSGPEQTFSLKLRCAKYPDFDTTVSTYSDTDSLKQVYIEKHCPDSGSIRLFFNGKELKTGTQIGMYLLTAGCVVQVFIQIKLS